jgi:acetyl-CoA C-acetyltransferase
MGKNKNIVEISKEPVVFDDTDERPTETSIEKLARLRPAFEKDETFNAGNSTTINDAATVLVRSLQGKNAWMDPFIIISAYDWGGVDPAYMELGTIFSSRKPLLLAKFER